MQLFILYIYISKFKKIFVLDEYKPG